MQLIQKLLLVLPYIAVLKLHPFEFDLFHINAAEIQACDAEQRPQKEESFSWRKRWIQIYDKDEADLFLSNSWNAVFDIVMWQYQRSLFLSSTKWTQSFSRQLLWRFWNLWTVFSFWMINVFGWRIHKMRSIFHFCLMEVF